MPAFARLGVKIVSTGCSADISKIVWEARREPASDLRDTLRTCLNLADPSPNAVQKKSDY